MEAYEAEKLGFVFEPRLLIAEAAAKGAAVEATAAYSASSLAETVKKHALKTGTTICGCIAKDAVVLAADTRCTTGSLVADKYCLKLHKLTPNIWCAGAGVAADLDHVTMTLAAELQIFTQQMGQMPRVETCVTRLCNKLFEYQGHIVTALIIGGVNPTGEMSLWYVSPNGYSHALPYMAMGSGGYFAQSILEAHYKEGLTVAEAKELCADAIEAGVMNDLGSGTGCDVVVLSMEDPQNPVMTRSFRQPVAGQKLPYTRPPLEVGTARVLSETKRAIPAFEPDNFSPYL